jgi:hypothetical protein
LLADRSAGLLAIADSTMAFAAFDAERECARGPVVEGVDVDFGDAAVEPDGLMCE